MWRNLTVLTIVVGLSPAIAPSQIDPNHPGSAAKHAKKTGAPENAKSVDPDHPGGAPTKSTKSKKSKKTKTDSDSKDSKKDSENTKKPDEAG